MELLVASTYGIPKPTLSYFESGRESDFALLKMSKGNLLNQHSQLAEQHKYQVFLRHLKLHSAFQLSKAFVHDPKPYTAA